MEQMDEIQLKKERILAFKILRDLGASVLIEDSLKKGAFQELFLAEECLSKKKSYIENISSGTEQLKHHDVIRLVSKIQQTLEKGCYLEGGTSEFKKVGKKPIRNFNIKKQLLSSVLEYFYELYNVEKREIEAYFQSMKQPALVSNNKRYQVINPIEISEQDIEQAIELDKVGYGNVENYIGIRETCIEWANTNPFIYFMVKDLESQKIVGYINAMPVSDELYEKLGKDEIDDINISPHEILSYNLPGYLNLYFASIVVTPKTNDGQEILRLLFSAIQNFFIKLSENNIIIKKMLAKEVSGKGKRLCNLFGMSQSKDNESIYEISLYPPKFDSRFPWLTGLFDCYAKHYEKSKVTE